MAAAAATPDADHAASAIPGDPLAGGGVDSACSTPFVSAPSSPSRERERDHHFSSTHGACFFSAPASPTRGGGAGGKEFGCLGDFDFDFSSRFPSPSAAAMSSADELFHNGQIRAVRLSAMLLQPQPLAPLVDGDDHESHLAAEEEDAVAVDDGAEADERGRIRSRSVRRKARSMSPFRTRWRAPSPAPAPAPESVEQVATPAASRSSSSSSTASSASSTSSRGSRRWAFLKDLLHRSKSDGGKNHHHRDTAHPPPQSNTTAPKRSPSPSPSPSPPAAAATARGGRGATGRSRRRSAHERLYEARRAEAEEMRRRTYLPYRQGLLLFGCIGLGSRGYGAVHGLARGLNAAAAVSSRS
uniref:Calmodulin-binding protein-like n=1 Tax=Oryza punctata TaxID=4537 RepID=A0A0E0MI31_ORYPU